MKVFCFGNPLIEGDSLSVELADELEVDGVEFVTCFYPEELFSQDTKELVILDVVKNVRDVCVIEDVDRFTQKKSSTAHDLDLGYLLKIKNELGELDSVRVICLPFDMDKKEAREKVEKIVKDIR